MFFFIIFVINKDYYFVSTFSFPLEPRVFFMNIEANLLFVADYAQMV